MQDRFYTRRKKIICLFLLFALIWGCSFQTLAQQNQTEDVLLIQDDAGLLTDTEKENLRLDMQKMSPYGNVIFYSVNNNLSSAAECAASFYRSKYGYEDGTLFLVDMDNREIYIYNSGEVSKLITNQECYTITDNIYTYASDADYYTCAKKAFEQEASLMEGRKIPHPMKYISNFLLAAVLAVICNYLIVKVFSRTGKPKDKLIIDGLTYRENFENATAVFTHETKVYNPASSGRGGSSGGGSSGGGGSSSGGGHSF